MYELNFEGGPLIYLLLLNFNLCNLYEFPMRMILLIFRLGKSPSSRKYDTISSTGKDARYLKRNLSCQELQEHPNQSKLKPTYIFFIIALKIRKGRAMDKSIFFM